MAEKFFDTRWADMPSVSSEEKKRIYEDFGVTITNPVSDPYPFHVFTVSPYRKEKARVLEEVAYTVAQYRYDPQSISMLYHELGQIKSALASGSGSEIPVFRFANAFTYGRNPYAAIHNWKKAVSMESAWIIGFDIETLGELGSKRFFTPTEISFARGKLTSEGLTRGTLEYSDIIYPGRSYGESVLGLLGRMEERARGTFFFTEDERLTIAGLLKYAEGAKFDTIDGMKVLTAPSPYYYKYVTDKGIIRWGTESANREIINRALEGLTNLETYGTPFDQAMKNLHNYLSKTMSETNAFFMGHNIGVFDIPAINRAFEVAGLPAKFAPENYIDTLELINAIHPSFLSLREQPDVSMAKLLRTPGGLYQMETLTKAITGEGYIHTAATDISKYFPVANALFFSKDAVDFINANVFVHGGQFGRTYKTGTFDTKVLKPGDRVFSLRGARAIDSDTIYSFKTRIVDDKEVVLDTAYYLNSQHEYIFEGLYQADGFYGIKLRNAMTEGEYIYINKRDINELRDFFHSRFLPSDFFTREHIQRMYEQSRDDIARSRFYQMTSNASYKNYQQLKRTLAAYNVEKNKGREVLEAYWNNLFSYNRQGERIVMDAWPEYYERMRERLGTDADFLWEVVKRVEKAHGGPDKKSPNYWPEPQRHLAVIEAYKAALEDAYGGTDGSLVALGIVGPKQYGFNIPNPDGGSFYINLGSAKDARDSLSIMLNQFAKSGNRNEEATREFFLDVLDMVGQHASTYEKRMGNVAYEVIKYELDAIRAAVEGDSGTHYGVNALANLLVRYRDIIPEYRTIIREVETLGPTRIPLVMDRVDEYVRRGINIAKEMTVDFSRFNGFRNIDNQALRTIRVLDRAMRQNLETVGIRGHYLEQFITMEKSLERTLGVLESKMRNLTDIDLGFAVYNTGTIDMPGIALAIFESTSGRGLSGSKTLAGVPLDKVREMGNVAVIDIPLVSADQYIYYGKQKKVAPQALLYRKSFKKGASWDDIIDDIEVTTPFDYMMAKIRFAMDDMLKAAQEGDYVAIEDMARRRIRDAIEYFTGSNRYQRDPERMLSEGAEQDFPKKFYVSYRGILEHGGEEVSYSGGPLWPSEKMNFFSSGAIHRIVREKLGVPAYLESTRGHHAAGNYFISIMDIRQFSPFGMYNSPGADRGIQAWNVRPLNQRAIDSISDNIRRAREASRYGGIDLNPLFITDSGLFLRTDLDNGFSTGRGINVGILSLTEGELHARIRQRVQDYADLHGLTYRQAYEELGLHRYFHGQAGFPSIRENQAIISKELADSLSSTAVVQKEFEKGDLTEGFVERVREVIKRKRRYELSYMEQIGLHERFQRPSKHYIIDIAETESGGYVLTLEQEFVAREGITKYFGGTEKFTGRHHIPKDILEYLFGEGVEVVTVLEHGKHHSFGEVAEGLIKQTIARINADTSLSLERKKEAIKEVQDIIARTFGLETAVRTEIIAGREEVSLVVDSRFPGFKHLFHGSAGIDINELGLENIAENVRKLIEKDNIVYTVDELAGRLGNVLSRYTGSELRRDLLVLELAMAANSEDINWLSIGGFGKQGIKVGPRHLSNLRDLGLEEYSRWLKEVIVEESRKSGMANAIPGSGGVARSLESQAEALGVLKRAIEGRPIVPEGVTPIHYTDVIERYRPLREGKTLDKKKGLYEVREIRNTIVNPELGGVWIELPTEVAVEVAPGERVYLREMYLAQPNIERAGKGYVLDDLGRAEKEIYDALRRYTEATQVPGKVQDEIPYDVANKALEDLTESIQRYYNVLFHEGSSGHGTLYERRFSARLPGSGHFQMQIMSPALELAGAVELAGGVGGGGIEKVAREFGLKEEVVRFAYESVVEAGYKPLTQTNVAYASRERILSMLDGLDDEQMTLYLEMLDEGKGLPGFFIREPTIHEFSAVPVVYYVDDTLDFDVIRINPTVAKAAGGDSDGDKISFAMAYYKKGLKADPMKMLEEAKAFGHNVQVTDPTGLGSWQRKIFQEYQESILNYIEDFKVVNPDYTGDVFDVIKEHVDFTGKLPVWDIRQMTDEEFSTYITRLSKAKLTNPTYTGLINNIVEALKRAGRPYARNKEELRAFNHAVEKLMQEPIDAKHFMTAGNIDEMVDPSDVVMWVKQGKFDNFLGTGMLEDSDINILNTIYERAEESDPGLFNRTVTYTFFSERMETRGTIKEFLTEWEKMPESPEKEFFKETYLRTQEVSDGGISTLDYLPESAKGINRRSSSWSERVLSQQERDKIARGIKDAIESMPAGTTRGGFGPLALVGSLIGGAILGAGIASSTGPLPMDYIEQPTMIPHSGSGGRQPMLDMNSVQNLLDRQGMDIMIKGYTTIDKDIDELAGIVSQAIRTSMEIPVNIQINTTDNRSTISQSWIEQQVLSVLQ